MFPVKQESVIIEEAPDNEEGDDAPSLVCGSDSDNSDDEDDNSLPTGRGHRVIVATKNYTPSHNNKTYGESHVETSMDYAYLKQQQAQGGHGGKKAPPGR